MKTNLKTKHQILFALLFCTLFAGASNGLAQPEPGVVETVEDPDKSRFLQFIHNTYEANYQTQKEGAYFGPREFSVSLLYGGEVTDVGGRNDLGGGHGVARASYFHTVNFGGYAQVTIDHDTTRGVDGFGAGLLGRIPFGRIAPYAGFGVDWAPRDKISGEDWTALNVLLGVDIAVHKNASIVGEVEKDARRWRMDELDVKAGIRIRF